MYEKPDIGFADYMIYWISLTLAVLVTTIDALRHFETG